MLNNVQLIGLLGKDPESKFFQNGDQLTTFSLATSERWKDKQTGEKKEKTSWHNIVCNRGLAKVASEYLKKGSKVYIGGKIDYQEWEKDGVKQYRTRIVADVLHMLDGKNESDQAGHHTEHKPAQTQQASGDKSGNNYDDFDDDIPF